MVARIRHAKRSVVRRGGQRRRLKVVGFLRGRGRSFEWLELSSAAPAFLVAVRRGGAWRNERDEDLIRAGERLGRRGPPEECRGQGRRRGRLGGAAEYS